MILASLRFLQHTWARIYTHIHIYASNYIQLVVLLRFVHLLRSHTLSLSLISRTLATSRAFAHHSLVAYNSLARRFLAKTLAPAHLLISLLRVASLFSVDKCESNKRNKRKWRKGKKSDVRRTSSFVSRKSSCAMYLSATSRVDRNRWGESPIDNSGIEEKREIRKTSKNTKQFNAAERFPIFAPRPGILAQYVARVGVELSRSDSSCRRERNNKKKREKNKNHMSLCIAKLLASRARVALLSSAQMVAQYLPPSHFLYAIENRSGPIVLTFEEFVGASCASSRAFVRVSARENWIEPFP